MCYADRQHSERARKLFHDSCKVLLASGNLSQNKLAAYRVLLTALEQGIPFDDAEAQLKEALHKAYKLDEELARVNDFKKWQAKGIFK